MANNTDSRFPSPPLLWDGESDACTAGESLGGYGGSGEESLVSRCANPIRFGHAGSIALGTSMSAQLQAGSRRGTTTTIKDSE